jgi:hypothetical protein
MSFVDHRCRCGQLSYRHIQGSAAPCGEPSPVGDPVMVPTFAPGTSVPTPMLTPGSVWAPGAGVSYQTCSCGVCVAVAASTDVGVTA